MLTKTQEQFFSLLRAGLWNNYIPDVDLFDNEVDWEQIYKIAIEQTVQCVVWDGIEKLSKELQPPKKLSLKWYSVVAKIEQSNKLLNNSVVELFELYESNGLKPILLKGQGVATLYPNPLHRCCGDIDVYIGTKDINRANEVLINKGAELKESVCEHHSHLILNNVIIENHVQMTTHFSNKITKTFDKALSKWYPEACKYIEINNCKIPVAPDEFNCQFIFLHLYRHFIREGIGLRHLCDWAILLNKYNLNNITLYGYKKPWQVLGFILVKYLGLDEKKLPLYDKNIDKNAGKMLSMILEEGNFGLNDNSRYTQRPKGYIAGKLFSFKLQSKRWVTLMQILPYDTLSYISVYKPKASFKQFISEI